MSRRKDRTHSLSRRAFLRMGLAPVLLRSAPLLGLFPSGDLSSINRSSRFSLADIRLKPSYPARSPLEDVLRRVVPGSDEYITEKYAFEIDQLFRQWSRALKTSPFDLSSLAAFLDPSIQATSLASANEMQLRSDKGIRTTKKQFSTALLPGRDQFLRAFREYLGPTTRVETAEFEIVSLEEISTTPLKLHLGIRYDLVIARHDGSREERVGHWQTEWSHDPATGWKATRWEAADETTAIAHGPAFIDVTHQALGAIEYYKHQMFYGADYWRTILDGACGIDVYGNNGIAAGDFDNDGIDDLYICQPAGLPNRLYRNRGDGTFEDVTEKSGVGVLDNTACALFADFENKGSQDLLVVCGSGPLLFLNQGNGSFTLKRDAFKFAKQPQGTFTHAAVADYDRDGRLDIYFCLYTYYLGLDQYHYPSPYFDARNGPPNFLCHNQGDGTFVDRTEAAGLSAENDRFSFACAWGDMNGNGWPDLYVANDFGRSNLYRNDGNGKFTAISEDSGANDVGAGMSACWCDFENDGRQDIYVSNMWSASGQRIAEQEPFHSGDSEKVKSFYRLHAAGNSLYKNLGNGQFKNVAAPSGSAMGRWAWSSDSWDFDHDGYSDLYVANGYISGTQPQELSSFFWRQVVGNSPATSTPSVSYERGWNAINELIRADHSWSGYERNTLYLNNHDGTFSDVSGISGLDFLDDSRSFALADLNHDGRLEVILKNRTAPQLRILQNVMQSIGGSVCFRLRGTKSNRDAIGASITLQCDGLRQTKYLQAGTGFLSQHSKELFFGLGKAPGAISATVHWPSGLSQTFEQIPANHRISIEEGQSQFSAAPLAPQDIPAKTRRSSQSQQIVDTPLTDATATWLIDPLPAADFYLQDSAGSLRSLC